MPAPLALGALKLAGGSMMKGAAKNVMKDKLKDTLKSKGQERLKKIGKDKLLGGQKRGVLVKRVSIGSALVKTETTSTVKQGANNEASGGSSLLNEVIEIKVTTIQIKDLLASNLAKQKAADDAARRQAEKDRKAAREDELETKKASGGKSGGGMKLPKAGPFEAIKRFLLMTFLGSLLAFALKHHKIILKAFNEITKNLTNFWKLLKYTITYFTTFGKQVLKNLFKTVKFFFKVVAGIGKFIYRIGKGIFNTLKRVANFLYDFLAPIIKAAITAVKELTETLAKRALELGGQMIKRVNQIRKFLQRAARAAAGALKGGKGAKGAIDAVKTAGKRSAKQAAKTAAKEATEKVAKEAAEKVAKETTALATKEATELAIKEATEIAVKEATEKVAKEAAEKAAKEAAEAAAKGGAAAILKNAKRFSGIFKRIPIVGALIGIGIDLALGESIDRAIVGQIGATIGAGIGGVLGQIAIPIPFFGAAAGGIVGGAIGEYLGKELYENFKNVLGKEQIKEEEPEVESKFLGGIIGAAKNIFSDKSSQTAVSSGGNVKEPVKLPGLSVSKIALKNNETYYGVTMNNTLASAAGGFGNIFGGIKDMVTGGGGQASGSGSMGSGGSGGGGTAGGAVAASDLYSKIGANAEQWDVFRNTVALIESGGKYNIFGGSGDHYDGRYQMGEAAKKDGSRLAGVEYPGHSNDPNNQSRAAYRANPKLQETVFTGFTLANHSYLMGNETYKNSTVERKLQILGYAHNQGMGGAEKWITTGVVGADGFGTKGTKYTDMIAANFRTKKSGGDLQIADGAVDVPSSTAASVDPSKDVEKKSTNDNNQLQISDNQTPTPTSTPIKPFSYKTAIHKDLRAGGTFGGSFGRGSGSVGKNMIQEPKSASFGNVNTKVYQIEESAHYDEPSTQIILMPPPQQDSAPQRKMATNTGKKNSVMPLFSLNKDINDIVSQAAFY